MTTYYPSAMSQAQAQAIEVIAGGESHDTDIRLQRRGFYSVRGISARLGCRAARSDRVQCRSDPDISVRGANAIAKDGSFELSGLPPGSYMVFFVVTPGGLPRERSICGSQGSRT